jgi:hypothetical protein
MMAGPAIMPGIESARQPTRILTGDPELKSVASLIAIEWMR